MSAIDRRPDTTAAAGGSSLLDTGLTADEAVALFGAGAVEAWYTLGELEGGEIGENITEAEFKNEADEIVITVTSGESFEVGNTLLSVDDETLALVELLADGAFRKFRYPLPMGVDADGNRLYQVWCFPNAKVVRENWRMAIQNGQPRKRPFKVRAYKKDGQPLYYVGTVRLDDQSEWPAELAGFKDDAMGAGA